MHEPTADPARPPQGTPSAPAQGIPPAVTQEAPAAGEQSAPSTGTPSPPAPDRRLRRASGRLGAEGLRPVSPKLIPVRYLGALAWNIISLLLVIGCIVVGIWQDWWWLVALAIVPIVWCLPALLLTPRRVRAIGYLDGEQELTVASGIMFRSVTTTPYGRVQSVDINEGPIERLYGLATLSFTTASTDADGSVPGLPKAEAERLKTLLTQRGIERMQSL